ncbi:hypothetical protein [Burkholderia cepacia]|uniref:Uncharacterized protein n=1 Tax=Burkholderia cepacia TaxID=292 RepID=A0ABM6NVF1_BURCE|nr:hypothetical protein [Burkholderia cepacia]AIO24935.1 hypothetical protein DM41_2896 [Burkholderia cepacia ATCC 25416]ALK18446.1 hypothetical protein APZ15_11880 [Burkholderia cepacia ATCC 25416]ASE96083.1 hypothetical protein CEQ23_22430 [Burkholderia cepacia]ATF78916.1 hypothetical protein CO711_16835 [Burkholderia cepacia]MCA8466951.1 hypothetical protein [Burkholderia cepacia]
MKTTILADGTLSISPESDLEAYALNQWGIANLDWSRVPAGGQPLPKMILDCSEYAGRLGVFVKINNLPTSGEAQ